MAEPTETRSRQSEAPEQIHWGISYLREDIQDIRLEIRGLHNRIDEHSQELRNESRQEFRGVHERIDETNQKIDESAQVLRGEFQHECSRLSDRIDVTYEQTIRRLDSRFTWMMTTMVALAGIVIAVFKI